MHVNSAYRLPMVILDYPRRYVIDENMCAKLYGDSPCPTSQTCLPSMSNFLFFFVESHFEMTKWRENFYCCGEAAHSNIDWVWSKKNAPNAYEFIITNWFYFYIEINDMNTSFLVFLYVEEMKKRKYWASYTIHFKRMSLHSSDCDLLPRHSTKYKWKCRVLSFRHFWARFYGRISVNYLIWITLRRSLGWIKSNVWLHSNSFICWRNFFRSKKEIMQLAGIQNIAVITTTVTVCANRKTNWMINMTCKNDSLLLNASTILTDDIIAKETQHFVDVDLFDDVPESFDHILYRLFAQSLQTKNRQELSFWLRKGSAPVPYCKNLVCTVFRRVTYPVALPENTFHLCSFDSTVCTRPEWYHTYSFAVPASRNTAHICHSYTDHAPGKSSHPPSAVILDNRHVPRNTEPLARM